MIDTDGHEDLGPFNETGSGLSSELAWYPSALCVLLLPQLDLRKASFKPDQIQSINGHQLWRHTKHD